VVEGLDRFLAGRRVEDEADTLTPVFDLDPEVIDDVSATPEQVDDDVGALPVPEMSRRRQKLSGRISEHASRSCSDRGWLRIVAAPKSVA